MALNANQSKNKNQNIVKPLDAGTYPGRLVMVVDLGLQSQREYQGDPKPPAYEILTTYEHSDEFMKDEDGNDIADKPRWSSESFALYPLQSEKAKSTKRYLALDPSGQAKGDWSKLLSTPVMITMVHNQNKKTGTVYANIAGISAMRAKDADKLPKLINPAVAFDMDNPDVEVFNKLPDWIKKKIMTGLEFKGSKLDKLLGGAYTPPPADADEGDGPNFNDEAPF